ncbi:hypothetical protein [Sphingobacterium sp.]|uniref:hypothetical protein n=1 Tax=Sphingobacterium sp. TaxID=341027 RepID=UPI0028AB649A|nr:hypothetical protein [Sphingobacterium sp.]
MHNQYLYKTFTHLKKIKGFKGKNSVWGICCLSSLMVLLMLNLQYGFNKNIPADGVWYAAETKEFSIKKQVVAGIEHSEMELSRLCKKETIIRIKPFASGNKVIVVLRKASNLPQFMKQINYLI